MKRHPVRSHTRAIAPRLAQSELVCARASLKKEEASNILLEGELNWSIDSLLHPLFDRSSAFMIVDTLLHGLIEQNPTETTLKFIKHNLPKLIKQIREETKKEFLECS